MKLILRKEARVQTQYFTTEGIATEISQLYILNNKAYDYLLMLMKVNFGFDRYILKDQINSDGTYLIELAVSKETLDRHLDKDVIDMLNKIMA